MLKLSPQRKLLVAILIGSAVGLHFSGSFVKTFIHPTTERKEQEEQNTKTVF